MARREDDQIHGGDVVSDAKVADGVGPGAETVTSEATADPGAGALDAGADAAEASATSDVDAVEPGAGAHLFKVVRIIGKPRYVAVVIEREPRTVTRRYAVDQGTFLVDRHEAIALVATGAFEIAPDSPAKLK